MEVINELIFIDVQKVLTYRVVVLPCTQSEPVAQIKKLPYYPELLFLHSSSWRHENEQLILTWMVAQQEDIEYELEFNPSVFRIASGTPTDPKPAQIEIVNILSHGLRHLSLLINSDEQFGDIVKRKEKLHTYLLTQAKGPAGEFKEK